MVFCDSIFSKRNLGSAVANYICDIDACKGSGKETFADFPH